MPFKDSSQPSFTPASPNLVGEVIAVNVDAQNPMRSTITVRANPADNLGLYEGDYTLLMDSSKSANQRHKVWQHARAEGNGFCGALITEDTRRRMGEKLLFEGVRLTGERTATTSWLRSYSNQRRRTPGLLKTMEVDKTDAHTNERYKGIRLVSVACQEGDAFSLKDEARWAEMTKRASRNFELGTMPSDYRNERGQLFLRSTMGATAATFALIDNDTNEVIEYSTLESKVVPNPADYPEHYTDQDKRMNNNQPARIPRDGENFEKMRRAYMKHIENNYPGRDITPICVEFTEYRVTTKTAKHRDLECPRDIKVGASANPLQDFHEANLVKFRDDISLEGSFSRGSYHPDICLQKSPNAAQTFSMYVRPEYDFQPQEFKHKPWLSFVSFNGKFLQLPEEMRVPHDLKGNVIGETHQETAMQQENAMQHAQQASQPPTEQQGHPRQQASGAEAKQQSPIPNDPAFDEADALESEEQEAQRINAHMQQHEQAAAGGSTTVAQSTHVENHQAAQTNPSQQRPENTTGGSPPLPNTDQYQQFASQFEHTEEQCPFSGM